jgi:sn-glycerol 3-phosphate transport system substrate-binding protein
MRKLGLDITLAGCCHPQVTKADQERTVTNGFPWERNNMKVRILLAAATALALMSPAVAQAKTQIQWWHAMGGALGQKLESIVAGYNKSQDNYEVVPTYKGTYPETMTAAIAAFRAHQQPDIVQVYEVGTGTMMAAKGAVYPVYQLMKDTGEAFNPKDYLAAVVGYYTDTDGNMLSLPFNSSTPILYYNKDVFKKAGLDPNTPPSWIRARRNAALPRAGSPGCSLRTSRPGTTCRSARKRTASAGSTRASPSTAPSRRATGPI